MITEPVPVSSHDTAGAWQIKPIRPIRASSKAIDLG
jgi:hypothetical protein